MMRFLALTAYILLALCYPPCLPLAKALSVPPPTLASAVRRAIKLSKKANVDPSFATEACSLWTSILGRAERPALPPGALPAAHALHASTLARVGRDSEALVEFRKSLKFLEEAGALAQPPAQEEVEVRTGMGKSLQRLLQYRDAADAFLGVAARCAIITKELPVTKGATSWATLAHLDSLKRAALCYMRIGELDAAIALLDAFEGVKDADMTGMLGALHYIQVCSPSTNVKDEKKHETFQTAQQLLRTASSASVSPLWNWIYLTSQLGWSSSMSLPPYRNEEADVWFSFAKINSILDDPDLVNLDDKILLHAVVMEAGGDGRTFWPQGYILPEDVDYLLAECNKHMNDDNPHCQQRNIWILKERSGYGSHGNSLASTDQVRTMYKSSQPAKSLLCQRVIHPPMLIKGYKFSLRIFVVYFPEGTILSEAGERHFDSEVYVSTQVSDNLCNQELISYVSS